MRHEQKIIKGNCWRQAIACIFMFAALSGSRCLQDSQDNNNDNGADIGSLKIVNTGIAVRHDGGLKVGDDLIVFGAGALNGVNYIVPSTVPVVGTPFTDSDDFVSTHFEIAGKKIVLLKRAVFTVTVYDTATGTSTPFDKTELRVSNIPVDENDQGPLHADGDFVVVCNDPAIVSDKVNLKVLDCSDNPPAIINLINAPGIDGVSSARITSARINATKRRVVGDRNDIFYLWDLDNPINPPREFDRSSDDGIGAESYRFDGTNILYADGARPANIHILNVETGVDTLMTLNPGRGALALAADKFIYFLERNAFDSFGVLNRSAIGDVPGPGATEGGRAGEDPHENDPEYQGYGSSSCITPDGSFFLIAGDKDITPEVEFLQASSGGPFELLKLGNENVQASDVSCSVNTIGFKTGTSHDTTVAYIILP